MIISSSRVLNISADAEATIPGRSDASRAYTTHHATKERGRRWWDLASAATGAERRSLHGNRAGTSASGGGREKDRDGQEEGCTRKTEGTRREGKEERRGWKSMLKLDFSHHSNGAFDPMGQILDSKLAMVSKLHFTILVFHISLVDEQCIPSQKDI